MHCFNDENFVAMDRESGDLKFVDFVTGRELEDPEAVSLRNVADYTVNQELTLLCAFCIKSKGHLIEVIDLNVCKSKTSFYLKEKLKFDTIDILLNSNNRFLLLRSNVLEKEKVEIEALWKKTGSFLPQNHPYKFTAVDLTQANGGVTPCLRTLSKIPHLGETIHGFEGNTVLVTTRRWVIFWDIPTGKCDQRVTKGDKKGMMYRPDWIGQECKGTSKALTKSKNGKLVAVGSDDGYVFIWSSDTGFPVEKKVPATKHTAPVS